eukprot:Colp12_sorted_trinity150504_noHs@31117
MPNGKSTQKRPQSARTNTSKKAPVIQLVVEGKQLESSKVDPRQRPSLKVKDCTKIEQVEMLNSENEVKEGESNCKPTSSSVTTSKTSSSEYVDQDTESVYSYGESEIKDTKSTKLAVSTSSNSGHYSGDAEEWFVDPIHHRAPTALNNRLFLASGMGAKSQPFVARRVWQVPQRPHSAHANSNRVRYEDSFTVYDRGLAGDTPFSLRLEQLRLEEARLLERKRSEELERVRGPKPRWYEMRTRDFTNELERHNHVLANQPEWERTLHYTHTLMQRASPSPRSHTYR